MQTQPKIAVFLTPPFGSIDRPKIKSVQDLTRVITLQQRQDNSLARSQLTSNSMCYALYSEEGKIGLKMKIELQTEFEVYYLINRNPLGG